MMNRRTRSTALRACVAACLAAGSAGCALLFEPPAVQAPSEAQLAEARRAAEVDAWAQRLRGAGRIDLAEEWAVLQRAPDPDPARTAMLQLHPWSPAFDLDAGLALVERLDTGVRRVVLRNWAEIAAVQRQTEERAREQAERAREQAERTREQAERNRDQLALQLERQRLQLREADRRAVDDRLRMEQERQRAEALVARIEELQRTMQALREIDRRQLDRNP